MTAKRPVCLDINGAAYRIEVEPRLTLADAIRQECGLTGTHVGCEHGICGACTVIVDGAAVRSCLMFAVQAEGCAIRTVEGLAPRAGCTRCRRRSCEHHGLQCGFCTPGFLMLAAAVLERDPAHLRRGAARCALGQSLPLHRLSGHHRRRARRGAA